MNRRSHIANRTGGFTLVEILVTIGIIVVLIGILIPVATGMRRQARVTTTQQLIAAIDSAINMYQADQRDWPGPFEQNVDRASVGTWTQINGLPLTLDNAGGPALRPTRSEELLLCLAGGMSISWPPATPEFRYLRADVGRGHVSLSPKNRGRMKDFMATTSSRTDIEATGAHFLNDTLLPEFVDSFESPIIYVRARKGMATTGAYYTPEFVATAGPPTHTSIAGGTLYNELGLYVSTFDVPNSYLTSDTLPSQVGQSSPTRQADRYILISAGPDKKFGTADDITNFGQPRIP